MMPLHHQGAILKEI